MVDLVDGINLFKLLPFLIAFGVAYALSKTIGYLLKKMATKIASKTHTILDDLIIKAIDMPLTFGLTILSVYVAAVMTGLNELPILLLAIKEGVLILVAITIYNLFNAFLKWYVEEIALKKNIHIADMQGTIKRVFAIFLIAITIIMVLDTAGIEVTPLIASLGIAGLAVALAFQDTLGNFFAGLYISLDRPLKEGDYIQLETGHEGYVIKVGWRSTLIRTLQNNVVVIPNSKLASSILTNFFSPDKKLVFTVPVSVSYESDLQKVEEITKDVAKKVLTTVEGGIREYEPLVRFNGFGDSGITFNVILQVDEFRNRALLMSEFIKALHARFNKEGIEIPYPKRDVYIKEHTQKKK